MTPDPERTPRMTMLLMSSGVLLKCDQKDRDDFLALDQRMHTASLVVAGFTTLWSLGMLAAGLGSGIGAMSPGPLMVALAGVVTAFGLRAGRNFLRRKLVRRRLARRADLALLDEQIEAEQFWVDQQIETLTETPTDLSRSEYRHLASRIRKGEVEVRVGSATTEAREVVTGNLVYTLRTTEDRPVGPAPTEFRPTEGATLRRRPTVTVNESVRAHFQPYQQGEPA